MQIAIEEIKQKYIQTVKVKSSITRSLPVENLLPQNVGSINNDLQQSTEEARIGNYLLQSTTTSYVQWRQRR